MALPRSDADRRDWLRLARSRRVGPVSFIRLMREYGSAAAALAALPGIAAAAGTRDYLPCPTGVAEHEIATGSALGARMLCLGEAAYPAALARIGDPPAVLWALGDPGLAARPVVALVGARNASALGLRMAQMLARELGELGFVVASGLARGIDASAHRAALATGTIAVQAGGIDVIYPPENSALAAEIAVHGLRLSEMPPGLGPQARHFPARNRIVSGLAEAVVVVEGATRSGSLITARNALDQGREVMAVPGHPFDARAAGCNMLIRDGATLVRSGRDVAEALSRPVPRRKVPGPAPDRAASTTTGPAGAGRQTVLNLLGPAPVSEDTLIRQTGLPAPMILEALSELDLAGEIERHPGGLVSRVA